MRAVSVFVVEDVAVLESALTRWADLVAEATGRDLRDAPGVGAAGGAGFGAMALLGAGLRSGAGTVLDLVYDPTVQSLDQVLATLEQQGCRTAGGWWHRFRHDWYRMTDANARDNARRAPWTCHQAPPGPDKSR